MAEDDAPTLAELQSRFQQAIVDGSDGVLSLIPANSRTSNAVLFGVYRHAYVARLVEVLRNAYPVLAQYMGEDLFTAMAQRYVALHPSRHANARWYPEDIPAFLAGEASSAGPELAEIAALERQLDLAFDAADAPVLTLDALAAHPPETWSDLSFKPHPSAAKLIFTTNAFDIWVTLKNGEATPAPAVLAEPETFLVWRGASVPTVRRLGAEERMLWTEAAGGRSFGALAEMAAVYDDPGTAAIRFAQHLQGWLTQGLLSEAMTAPTGPANIVAPSGQTTIE